VKSGRAGEALLRVLIIGCGNIAGGFDQNRRPEDFPLTHAGAYTHDGRFDVVACVEPDDNRRRDFMETWRVPAGFCSINDLADSAEQFDVISIASPTVNHAHDLRAALQLKPKLVFCEKPLTTSLNETEKLVDEYGKADVLLAVNYSRRWDPDVLKLHVEISKKQRGELRSVVGIYNKGLLNNGSHLLDLLHFFFGPLKIIRVGKPVNDYSSSDPTVPVWMEGALDVPIHLACAHAQDYAMFELQLIFSNGVLIMEEGGMFWSERRVVDSDSFKGYRKLDRGIRRPGEYPRAMVQAVDNIYNAILQGTPLASTGTNAIDAQRVCESVARQACEL